MMSVCLIIDEFNFDDLVKMTDTFWHWHILVKVDAFVLCNVEVMCREKV